jgi:hypothetical protein
MKFIESVIYLWTQSNNSFNRSGNTLAFIDNLDAIPGFFPPRQLNRYPACGREPE